MTITTSYHLRTSAYATPSSSTLVSRPVSTTHLPRGDDGDGDDGAMKCIFLPPACKNADCTLTLCGSPFSSLHWPTGLPTTGTISSTTYSYSSDTLQYPTATASSSVYSATSTGSVGTSVPSESSRDVGDGFSALQIAGIVLGSVLGAVLLGVFFWLLRRGMFGSGTLCGLRYGLARYPGWRPDGGLGHGGAEMRQEQGRKGGAVVTPFEPLNSTSSSLPSYPSSTLAGSGEAAHPFLPGSKLHSASSLSSDLHGADSLPRPRSPTAWSTSPSAFDNTYGSIAAAYPSTVASGSVVGSGSHSAPSDAMSMSEVSTLVSDTTGQSFPSTAAVLSYTPPPSSRPRPPPPPHARWENTTSTPRAILPMPVRGHSPAPTMSTASTGGASATSTIEGVRISSWHSSDSEETELIVRERR
ncbi:hypothetical protein C8T65DRAFT_745097 [Cerioporus squamosus]|nr:hypothetical protein C8T65DRAFT_745097 [Cerioporus squamosus]